MSALTAMRDHCQRMADGKETTLCYPSGRSYRGTSDPADRPLWAQLAREIDRYLAGEPDVVQATPQPHDEGLWP